MDYQQAPTGTRITLKVGRVGYAIGKKGKTIKKISEDVKNILNSEDVQIEVDQLDDPDLNPDVMAVRLASSLQRGRHFRRTAYGTVRRIMAKGALGVEIIVAGKITSQRARVEKFRDGFIAKTGDPKRKFVRKGYAVAKIKRGILGISVLIMMPNSVLPDHVDIIEEPTHKSKEIITDETNDHFEEEDDEFTKDLSDSFDELETLEEIPEEALEIEDEELGETINLGDEDES